MDVNLSLSIWLYVKFLHAYKSYWLTFKSDLFGFLYWSNVNPLSICYYINNLSTSNIWPSSVLIIDGFLIVFNVNAHVSWSFTNEKCLLIFYVDVILLIESNTNPKKFLIYKKT